MGKYVGMKCRGAAPGGRAAPPAASRVVLGVRTRSRTALPAAVARPRRRKAAARAAVVEEATEALGRFDASTGADAGVCYLHLRSRRLFMAAAAPRGHGTEAAAAGDCENSAEAVVVPGISRCSSTASSVDVSARERISGGAAEPREDSDVESSVSDSGRERRETTPSSRPPGDSSDLGSSHSAMDEKQLCRRNCPATTTTATSATTFPAASRPTLPPAAEIEEFFATAEKAEAERFAAKYNFDVARGVPINAGRFDWTPVVASG